MRNLPRYKYCFVCGKENRCGLNITFKTDGKKVFVEHVFDRKHEGYIGRVHGGVIAAILDEAMGWACTIITKKMYFTIGLEVKYKRAVPSSERITVEATMIEEKHGICFASAVMKDATSRILTTANGKYYPLSNKEEREVLLFLHHEPEDDLPVSKDDF